MCVSIYDMECIYTIWAPQILSAVHHENCIWCPNMDKKSKIKKQIEYITSYSLEYTMASLQVSYSTKLSRSLKF